MQPLRAVRAGALEVAFYEAGPADGPPVFLLHGFPYDIHSYVEVAPRLAARGCRVLVPYLRGYGPTRFLSEATPRSGEQAALGAVLDRVGAEHRGVDLGDGVHQRREALAFGAPVGQEQALVLAREGRTLAVLEQARGAHDERALGEVVEGQ